VVHLWGSTIIIRLFRQGYPTVVISKIELARLMLAVTDPDAELATFSKPRILAVWCDICTT